MPQDKDELLQVLITKYAQMYMKLAYAIGAAKSCGNGGGQFILRYC